MGVSRWHGGFWALRSLSTEIIDIEIIDIEIIDIEIIDIEIIDIEIIDIEIIDIEIIDIAETICYKPPAQMQQSWLC